jgi:hypothetical protein
MTNWHFNDLISILLVFAVILIERLKNIKVGKMKKLVVLLVFTLVLFSCKTSSVTNTQLDKNAQVQIKGTWRLNSVTFPRANTIAITSFDITDSKCFTGSTWNFIPNNNKGSMSLNAVNCPAYSSAISWFINKNGEFVLKFLNAASRSDKVRQGFVLQLRNQTATSFQLVDTAVVEGQIINVVYEFYKNN